ncbi:LysR family transcriptional regulator [Pseudoalteromonas phenolica]|uniref:LysR family transcriptional regulator n=2 Tax=Pseudoalteromonas phenolica TaxID=161398 RepID=A0A5S3YY04_9GAMM|nr:LysR family transcriptional regulator [Pseudoalteromonas phenolica]TMN92267.1 LysR family transcriptional regulator [Pseudoalteromonas phenolica]TMP83571.1 LysR family transcriptional regulator [Pseudoalteromonas phenolica]
MDIRVFKTFIAVAENRHFGRAAETLYITQAAVSARIKQLEEFYNTALFIREKNNLRLTPAGEALLSHAHLMVSQMAQSKLSLSIAAMQKNTFSVAATPNVWDAFFSSRIQDMLALFDDLVVGAELSVREAIQRKLEDRSLDVGLLTDPIKDSDFCNELIGHFDLSLVGSRPQFDAKVEDYVLVDWGITFQKEHALHHKVTPNFKTSAAMIALEVLQTKGGFAYLPYPLVQALIENGELFEIDTPLQIKRPIYLVYRKNNPQEKLITEFKALFSKLQ